MRRLFALALLLGACSEGPLTYGEFCTQMGESFCTRAITGCRLGTGPIDGCVSSFVGGCCAEGGTCGNETNTTQSELDGCRGDMEAQSCQSIEYGFSSGDFAAAFPPSCLVLE